MTTKTSIPALSDALEEQIAGTVDRVSKYHLRELQIALDPTNPSHILPPALEPSKKVLDIGCGAGQTLIAAYPDRVCFGVDLDAKALRLGRTLAPRVCFAQGKAEALPCRSGEFDRVIARVCICYTHIRPAMMEIRRVLKRGGDVWMTLHSVAHFFTTWKGRSWRGKLISPWVLFNGILFHVAERQVCLAGKYETFQTESGMRRTLERCGFGDISIQRGRFFVVTARAR